MLEEAERLNREGVDEDLFQRLKKAAYGFMVRSLNSFENICVSQTMAYFNGYEYLTFPQCFETITKADVEACIHRAVSWDRSTLAVVKPKEGA